MKKYNNWIFVLFFVLLSVLVIFLNIKSDPYNLKEFKNGKTEMEFCSNLPKHQIYKAMNLTRENEYDYLFIGGSALGAIYVNDFIYKKFGKKVINMPVDSLSPKELYLILKDFLDIHPEVKMVFIELSLHSFLESNDDEEQYVKTTKFDDFLKYNFSIEATKKSIEKLIFDINKNIFNNQNSSIDDELSSSSSGKYVITHPYVQREYNINNFDNNKIWIKNIKELMEEKNIKAVFYTPLVHAFYLAKCYKTGYYSKLEEIKRYFVKYISFYDMAKISKYTTKRIDGDESFYYLDVLHPSFLLFEEFVNLLVLNIENEELATYITQDNIDENMKQQEKLLKKYINENEKDVENYLNAKFSILKYNESKEIKVNIEDIKVNESELVFLRNN